MTISMPVRLTLAAFGYGWFLVRLDVEVDEQEQIASEQGTAE